MSGINKDVSRSASSPQYATFNNKLYAIWRENNASGVRQTRLAVYNGIDTGPIWTFVDGNGANGINKDATKDATSPQLVVFNRKLYATWVEEGTSVDQVRVVVYNGLDLTPGWTFVDGNGTDGLNKDTAQTAANPPQFAVVKRKLYLMWREVNGLVEQIRVAVYNGSDLAPGWTFVDGNGANGINKDVTMNAFDPQIIMFKQKLFAVWAETNNTDQIRVAVYNGLDLTPAWTFVDGNGADGINKDTGRNAWAPQFAVLRASFMPPGWRTTAPRTRCGWRSIAAVI